MGCALGAIGKGLQLGKLGSCLGNSFTGDTPVLMADGTHKRIKDVRAGDRVIATDPETGTTRTETVTTTIQGEGLKNFTTITIDTDGPKGTATGTITATDGHPIWVLDLRDWIDASELKPGMWLRTSAGTHVQITAVQAYSAQQRVYNLSITGPHTYYVAAGNTPVLVHNCTVYREDQRSPDIIAALGGFVAKGGTNDLKLYVSSKAPSVFVSTSKSLRKAIPFTMNNKKLTGYVYRIEGAPGGIDVNKTIGLRWILRNAFPGEREVAFEGGIGSRYITAYREYRGGRPVGDWIPFPGGG